MEAHPGDKEGIMDTAWRGINEIVSFCFLSIIFEAILILIIMFF